MIARNIAVLIVLLVRVSDLHAQSAKKINEQLKRELEIQWLRNDSLLKIYNQQLVGFRTMSASAGTSIFGTLKAVNFEVEEMRHKCIGLRDTLNWLSFYESQLDVPQINTGYYSLKAELFSVLGYVPKDFPTTRNNAELPSNKKEQNIVLQAQLKEMQDETDSLKAELQRIDRVNKKLKAFNQVSDSYMSDYSEYLSTLTTHYRSLLQKKYDVRQEYLKKGPKGYAELYKRVFNDLFQDDPYWNTFNRSQDSDGVTIMDEVAPGYVPPTPVYDESYIYYDGLDEKAEFVGGKAERLKFISENIFYPDFALSKGIGGKCLLKFVVDKSGKITEPMIAIGVGGCQECDQEAMRILRMMPEWVPAKKNGKAVNSYYFLPITFKP